MLETKANLSTSHTQSTQQVRPQLAVGARIKDEQEMFDIRSKLYSVRFKP